MKNNKNEKNIHVFGLNGINRCSKEEYDLLFNKDFNIKEFINPNKSDFLSKFSKMLGISLFIVSNPKNTFAYSTIIDKLPKRIGGDIFNKISGFTIYGILIVTAVRLLCEYGRGGSKHRLVEIVKECIFLVLATLFLPKIPDIAGSFVDKYLDIRF